jgi:hypothetical protein
MSNKNSNFPSNQVDNIEPSAVQEIVTSLRQLNAMGQCKTDTEVETRINQYFEFCERSSLRPGIESLCLSLHISRTTLYNWCNGDCSEVRQELALNAKSFIASFLEQASLTGKLNPATSCFLFKNWLNYKDNYSFEDSTDTTGHSRQLTASELPRLGDLDLPTRGVDLPILSNNNREEN